MIHHYRLMVDHALIGVEARHVPEHTYASSPALDHEIYTWFRGRWPAVPIATASHRHYLVDPTWWATYFSHFDGEILGIRDNCILQLDTTRPLVGGNFEIVLRGVWVAIEIARNKELIQQPQPQPAAE
jgi:hypothetical protein